MRCVDSSVSLLIIFMSASPSFTGVLCVVLCVSECMVVDAKGVGKCLLALDVSLSFFFFFSSFSFLFLSFLHSCLHPYNATTLTTTTTSLLLLLILLLVEPQVVSEWQRAIKHDKPYRCLQLMFQPAGGGILLTRTSSFLILLIFLLFLLLYSFSFSLVTLLRCLL